MSAPVQLLSSIRRLSSTSKLSLLGFWFLLEWIPVSMLAGQDYAGFRKDVGTGNLFQLGVLFACLYLGLCYTAARSQWSGFIQHVSTTAITPRYFTAHCIAFAIFVTSSLVFTEKGFHSSSSFVSFTVWLLSGALAIVFLGLTIVSLPIWKELFASTRSIFGVAFVLSMIAWLITRAGWYGDQGHWKQVVLPVAEPVTHLTFELVRRLLSLLIPTVVTDWSTVRIGGPSFQVEIGTGCAGFEGTALILVFSGGWLYLFRHEFRFPRAFLLMIVGLAVMWLSNAVRITALIMIGIAGFPNIAVNGFHSQAGWILFNAVAISFALASRRLAWFRVQSPGALPANRESDNPTATYLAPFLAILAASMVARAAAADFEWFYPLRVIAALFVLYYFRREYAKLDWRFGWQAVLTGAFVFCMWIGLDKLFGGAGSHQMPQALASSPSAAQGGWLAFRIAGAVLTVPIAEELAFRGFLIRRIMKSNFDDLGPMDFSIPALAVSSLAFGMMHGDRWLAGTFAGLLYAAVYLRKGRIGDAVVAHASTNLFLAVYVLATASWNLW